MLPDLRGLKLDHRYELQKLHGSGGMALVFVAHDHVLNRRVAVKVIKPEYALSSVHIAAAIKEARIAAGLKHRHIVSVYDQGQHAWQGQNLVFLVMHYAGGGVLSERLEAGPLAFEEAGRILKQIGEALDYAHERAVIHLDLKPHNILFGEQNEALVTDFGLARVLREASRVKGHTGAGTPDYMAPEQIMGGDVGPFSDVYALGVTLYQMLTGQIPRREWTPEGLVVHLDPTLHPAVRSVIARATWHTPAYRYQTAGDLARDFGRALRVSPSVVQWAPPEADLSVAPPPVGAPPLRGSDTQPTRRPRRELSGRWLARLWRRWPLSLAGAGLLVALILGGLALFGTRSSSATPPHAGAELSAQAFRSPTTTLASPTSTPTAAPTAVPPTPTPSPSPSAAPTLVPPTTTPTPTPFVRIDVESVAVRAGPGEEYPVVGEARQGDLLSLLGRTTDASWWQVEFLGWERWIPAWAGAPSVPSHEVPVAPTPPPPPPPPPTSTPAPAPTASPPPRSPTPTVAPALQNPGFAGVSDGRIPGWSWSALDNFTGGQSDPSASYDTPLIKQADDPVRMISGPTLQIDAVAHVKFRVYVFQTLNVSPGVVLRFQAWAGAYTDIASIQVAAGIDPNGGHGCTKAQWGETLLLNQSSAARQLRAPDVAAGRDGRVTVCLYAEPLYPTAHSAAFFDEARLAVISR